MFIRWVLMSAFLFSGCLRTREDLKEVETANAMRDQVTSLQKVHADSSTRLEELQDQNRQLNGRIEELEHRLVKTEESKGEGKDEIQKNLEDTKRSNQLLQDSIAKMETQLQALQEEIVALRAKEASKSSKSENGNSKDKDKEKSIFEAALADFQDKKWKEAILNFDQYREKNPKGKFAAEATYKTGVCFQELGMNDEAKVFYQETVAKFPQSDMAKKAQYRLKALK
jgi:TolA-binding protein